MTARLLRLSNIKAAVAAGTLPRAKYSVTTDKYSMGSSITVVISKLPFPVINPAAFVVDRGANYARFDREHFSSRFTQPAQDVDRKVNEIIEAYHWDRSDHMTSTIPVWTSTPIQVGPIPQNVVALTVVGRGDRARLYALETQDTAVRLLRIETYGTVSVLATWKTEARDRTFSIAASANGDDLLVASSQPARHVFLALTISGGEIATSSIARGKGPIVVPPRAEREGILWGTNAPGDADPKGRQPIVSVRTSYSELTSIDGSDIHSWL